MQTNGVGVCVSPDVISVTFSLIGGIEARRQNWVVDCLFVVSILSVFDRRLEFD